MRIRILRPLLVLALLAGIQTVSKAQAAPDCSNCACTLPSMFGANMWTSTTQPACDPSNPIAYAVNAGRFARFYAVPGRRYTFSLCNNALSTQIFITTNTTIPGIIVCDNNGCGTNNGPSQVAFVAPVPAIYRLYILNGACPNAFPDPTPGVEVMMTCTPIAPPPNDLPCGAINLPINGDDCLFTTGDNQSATNSAGAGGIGNIPVPACTGALYQGYDLWYTVTVPASGLIGIQSQEATLCAGAFELYTTTNCATGTAFTPLAGSCTVEGITAPNTVPALVFDAFAAGLAPGATVYIRYWERNGNENGLFGLCAYEAERPVNDDPCDAVPLPLNTSCVPEQHTFENASPSTIPNPTCGNTAAVNDVWFTFQVPIPLPGNYTGISVNTSATTPVDLAMAWYRMNPTCADMTQIACSPTANINSQAINPNLLIAGETIYVRLWGEAPWQGTYDICALLNQAPANDEPCGAIALDLNYGCLMETFANSSATVSLVPGAPPCGNWNANANDVWFTVTVPPSGQVQLDMLAGSLNNASMAVYESATNSCANLVLATPAPNCATNGSQQGVGNNNMPYLNLSGHTPGQTLWIRVWRVGASTDGTFGICARNPTNPPGACFYTLTMNDTGGDGWGGSYVTICVGGTCTDYTTLGSSASINIGANIGQVFTVSYTAVGGQQIQNSYQITQYFQPVFTSGTTPATGLVYSETVECNPPPAPAGDCMGAQTVCSDTTIPCQPYQPGVVSDLNGSNSGCMSGQNQGVFMILTFGADTPPCSPAAFDVVGGNVAGCGTWSNNIFDFVVWGPYTNGGPGGSVNAGGMCPIQQLPYRCNWSSIPSPTVKGLAFNNLLPVSNNGAGGPMARHLVVNPGDHFLLFVNNWSNTGQQFQIQWKTAPAGFQVLASDCNQTSPWVDTPVVPAPAGTTAAPNCTPLPVEFLSFEAFGREKHVDVKWSTAIENGSDHFMVQRSADGETFTNVGRVDAAGFSYEVRNYTFVDDAPLMGLSYYRLEQVDMDGRSTRTHVVPVMFKDGRTSMEVFPNPANETLWLSFDNDGEMPMHWRITDASGRLITEANVNTTTGRNLFEIPIERLDQGTYMIELVHKDGNQAGISRFVKQ